MTIQIILGALFATLKGLLLFTVVCSLFEWTLHRFVMHTPVPIFMYPYKKHAKVHHHVFKADETYHLINPEDLKTIPMAWWNGPALIALGTALIIPFGLAFHSGLLVWHGFLVFVGYYGAYEYLHMCMHYPKKRQLELSWPFRWINGHHILHHRYMGKNFNVVWPIADLCLGTMIWRAKKSFRQVRGPSVPDLQPKQRKAPKPPIPFLELP